MESSILRAARIFTADWVYTLEAASGKQETPTSCRPIEKGYVALDEAGKILATGPQTELEAANRTEAAKSTELVKSTASVDRKTHRLDGLLCPGFINAHCHLELSHMHGAVPTKTGLPAFLRTVTTQRAASPEEIAEAMQKADTEMLENGIVACGDISNNAGSIVVKQNSKIRYHTFVERFGTAAERAKEIFEDGAALTEQFRAAGLDASLNPHAPYSISAALLSQIFQTPTNQRQPLTIHMQENPAEDELYRSNEGAFNVFLESIGAPPSDLWPTGKSSLQSIVEHFPKDQQQKLLLVHNTYSDPKELAALAKARQDIYWCLCPSANLYIENRLPNLEYFTSLGDRILLGTDSLSSNWQLSILSEMQQLKQQQTRSTLPNQNRSTQQLLECACSTAAEFFGWKDLGTLSIGKTPGLNLITVTEGGEITADSQVRKLA